MNTDRQLEASSPSAPSDARRVQRLFDILIPGSEDWPVPSEALPDVDLVLNDLSAADHEALDRLLTRIAEDTEAAVAAIREFERTHTEAFARVLSALYSAYYGSPAVKGRIAALAEVGPREASAAFDPALVQTVLRTQAGKRRLVER